MRNRLLLQRFLQGMRIITTHADRSGRATRTPRTIKKLPPGSAATIRFTRREGGEMSVAEYFQDALGRPLEYPDLPCVEVGSGAFIPVELCQVLPGQIMRKQIPVSRSASH